MKWLINKAFLTPSVEQLLRLQAELLRTKTIIIINFFWGGGNKGSNFMKWLINKAFYGARPKIFQPLSNRLHHW